MLKQIIGDPVDIKAFIKSALIVAVAASAVSVRFIDEECLACGRRECPMNRATPLRKMSIAEWLYDTQTDGDLHSNGVCTTVYTIFINKRN